MMRGIYNGQVSRKLLYFCNAGNFKYNNSKKIYMKEFLKEFSEKYNSIEEYLKLIGVKEYIIKDIKRKYIEQLFNQI